MTRLLPGALGGALVLALAALSLLAGSAAAAVPGSEYAVSFVGSASAEVHWEDASEESGRWTVEDDAADLWLPATVGGEAVDAEDSSTTQAPYDALAGGTAVEDPGTFVHHFVEHSEGVNCEAAWIYDEGDAVVSADVALGQLVVGTTYASPLARHFTSEGPGGSYPEWSCTHPEDDGPGATGFIGYPPSGHGATAAGGQIAYSTTVPVADVGEASFSLPASDQSTINGSGWWHEAGATSHRFQLGGSYTFAKVCDGTIFYAYGFAEGTCAGSGAGSGGGSGGGGGAGGGSGGGTTPSTPPTAPVSAAGASRQENTHHKKRKHHRHKKHKKRGGSHRAHRGDRAP
ncbi:MAG TPA: hypothetical protein VMF55_13665 [Solirubrobacterales bacterium]|nr:hypothetical protein [Solirubrobacterales bacterium]